MARYVTLYAALIMFLVVCFCNGPLSWTLFPGIEQYDARLWFRLGTLIPAMVWFMVVAMFFIFTMPSRKRKFTLHQVHTGYNRSPAFHEWFVPDGDATYEFPAGVPCEFWINLEDIDDGRHISAGVVYQVKPVFLANMHNTEQHAYDDLVHVRIAKDGHVTAEYVSGSLFNGKMVKGAINFTVSEAYYKKNTSVTNDVQVTK